MNIGKDNKHPDYICDKCGNRIRYVFDKVPKGFVGLNKYYKQTPSNPIKRSFDLCGSCEKKFRTWLNTKEIPTMEEVLSAFPQYEEEIWKTK